MGWNDLVIDHAHPVLSGIATGDHAYFVHSYHFRVTDPAHRLAHVDYAGDVTAIIGRDTMVGTQFHPEKSQAAGLRLIANFLTWATLTRGASRSGHFTKSFYINVLPQRR